jgi:hypothetical protein
MCVNHRAPLGKHRAKLDKAAKTGRTVAVGCELCHITTVAALDGCRDEGSVIVYTAGRLEFRAYNTYGSIRWAA